MSRKNGSGQGYGTLPDLDSLDQTNPSTLTPSTALTNIMDVMDVDDNPSALLLPGTEDGLDDSLSMQNAHRAANAQPFDDVMEEIGIGKYQRILLLMCGWANAADAVELLGMSFVITSLAECDLDLTPTRKGWVTSGMFIGMMFGGWIWGSFADKIGRRTTLIVALLFNVIFGMGSSLATNFHSFLFFRIMSGSGVGGGIPIVFTYMTEFLPNTGRGAYLNAVAAFWMVGTILVAGMAWGILGAKECSHGDAETNIILRCETWYSSKCGIFPNVFHNGLRAWRLFVFLCTFPSLIASIALIFAPESPKWLLTVGRTDEAESVLTRIKKANRPHDTTPIILQPDPAQGLVSAKKGPETKSRISQMLGSIAAVLHDTGALFHRSSRGTTVVLAGIWITLSFGFYGLTLWLPDYFQQGAIDSSLSIYQVSFYVALANLPGNIFALWAVEKLGRKVTLISSMAVSAVSIVSILEIHTSTGTTAFSCVFSGVSVAGWNALSILTAELYSTRKRGAAFGFLAALGRIGSILGTTIFGVMSANKPGVPLVLSGAALAAGAVLAFWLKETSNTTIG
eukprot:m.30163 g.30163  ORF g.30163 m.30163 type:complete len:568 (-) comp9254_c0_seq1:137-1840(-)